MANPTAEGNSLLDPKGPRKLLKAAPLGTISEHGEASQPASQRGAAARNARSQPLQGISPPTKINSNLAPGSVYRACRSKQREGLMPFSGTKNSLSRYPANSA
jgi:hypothetical protein